ncbi:xanthine dehydrogenase family protein molybdopterin-binding subunit [Luteibacter sp. UNCMF366Tsu5.1]|uniref:xanthine dehydrogenase family protein molybdopterin-binding subunit n=1 Tax=Luteibacter sp. UNCMF366Tsu5.1 TaxID=1502758 RepID=UPI000908CD25|nr:molybdopterin cofactor-binding domain-containing protein [Luteibacter sp. UNCMF366Tsu5.1]SFW69860.1 isoquinoline 1-oxidoreductase, beta subunit [Luteibacter sp. UNCMF366Tsu5.1]
MSARHPMDESIDAGRRQALRLAGGGLAVAFLWSAGAGPALAQMSARRQPDDAAAAAADGNPPFAPNAFVRVGADGSVRLVMPSAEMGQAIYTGIAMMLAEELGVGLDQVKVEHSPPNDALYGLPLLGGGQITGGSTSTRGQWQVLREAGAVAREMLVAAAAAQWHVDPASCSVARGVITHVPSGRTLGFGAVADAAGKLPQPANVTLKQRKDFTLIGKPLRRVDSADKVNGGTQFGIDVKVPGMKIAAVKTSPELAGTLGRVDETQARAIPGVIDVLKLGDAVAVVGEHYWAAQRGLESLVIEWTPGVNAHLDTETLVAGLRESSEKGPAIVGRKPKGEAAAGGKLVEASFVSPMLAHATMEPLNATVHVTAGHCEIWTGTQVPTRVVKEAARICGIPAEAVTVNNQYLGGGFGRRLETDQVEQAVAFAKQVTYPLKVIWSREEDIRHDRVRPLYFDRISATLGADGKPTSWKHRITSGTVLGRWMPGAMGKDGMDSDAIESAADLPYDMDNVLVEWVRHEMPPGLVVGWWRGVGPTHNLFIVESFIDELAHVAGKDPLAYRRSLMKPGSRALGVLDLAAEKIGWGSQPLPARVGRGIAVGSPFGSHVCAIVEAEVTPQGTVRLRKAVVAVDNGITVNPSSVQAQMQGGLLFGLSAAMYSGITLKNGVIEQSNFHDYRNLRINEVPEIEVYSVENDEAPGGIGEVGTAIAAPALANAIFAATGVRLRELPISRTQLAASPDALKRVASTGEHKEDVA